MTNSQDHQLQDDLALSILGDLVVEPGPFRDRLLALPTRPPVVDPSWSFEPPAGMADLVTDAAMPATGDEAARWAAAAGAYRAPAWGVIDPTGPPDRFLVVAGVPYFESNEAGPLVRHRLVEVAPTCSLQTTARRSTCEALSRRGRVSGSFGVAGTLAPTWEFVLARALVVDHSA